MTRVGPQRPPPKKKTKKKKQKTKNKNKNKKKTVTDVHSDSGVCTESVFI
jgi:hypothetical protein